MALAEQIHASHPKVFCCPSWSFSLCVCLSGCLSLSLSLLSSPTFLFCSLLRDASQHDILQPEAVDGAEVSTKSVTLFSQHFFFREGVGAEIDFSEFFHLSSFFPPFLSLCHFYVILLIFSSFSRNGLLQILVWVHFWQSMFVELSKMT